MSGGSRPQYNNHGPPDWMSPVKGAPRCTRPQKESCEEREEGWQPGLLDPIGRSRRPKQTWAPATGPAEHQGAQHTQLPGSIGSSERCMLQPGPACPTAPLLLHALTKWAINPWPVYRPSFPGHVITPQLGQQPSVPGATSITPESPHPACLPA